MTRARLLALLLCLAVIGALLPASSSHAAVTQKGTYYALATTRILDTRTGNGAPKTPLGPAKTLQLQVSGRGGVPAAGVSAVVVNLTVTGGTANSFLTAYPSGKPRPTVSSINYQLGKTRANIATLPLGTGGKVAIYNNGGSVSVLADVLGFYASDDTALSTPLGEGSEFMSLPPERLIDTRTDSQGALAGQGGANILTLYVDFGTNGSLSSSVTAVAVNLTVVGAATGGYLNTWNGNGDPPPTSTLSFSDPAAIANMAVIKTALCGDCGGSLPPPVQFALSNQSQNPVHVLVDLVGVYYNDGTAGLRFSPLTPIRITDSRIPRNGTTFTGQQTQTLTAPSTVAGADTVALVSNVTIVAPPASTFLTLWAAGEARPASSNVNTPAGTTAANGAVVPLSATNRFGVYNAAGRTNFLIDVSGRFDGSAAGARASRAGSTPAELGSTRVTSARR